MRRDTRRLFEAKARELEPKFRDAFLQAIADIKRAADIERIARLLEQGDVAGVIEALRLDDDIFAPLREAMRQAYLEGGGIIGEALPKKNPATGYEIVFRFDGYHDTAERWLREKAGDLIKDIADGERSSLREALVRSLHQGRNPKQAALDLVGRVHGGKRVGGIIGLTGREKGYVAGYREKLVSEDRKADQIDRMVAKYENKLLRLRGERIARTETLEAMHAGRYRGMDQLIERGEVKADAVTKTWDATGDARTRPAHMAMDRQTVKFREPFRAPNGSLLMHPCDNSLGARPEDVIQCRCWAAIKIDYFADLD